MPHTMTKIRAFAAVAAVVTAGACTETTPTGPELPPWASEFVFFHPHLSYLYVDSSPGTDLRLEWSGDTTYSGWNCLLFAPTTAGDSTGEFFWVIRGFNRGRMLRTQFGVEDSLDAFLLPPSGLGTRGTFLASASGAVTLDWADGTPSRYFDPAANIRIEGDTIFSDVTLNFADGFVQWRVGWLRVSSCP